MAGLHDGFCFYFRPSARGVTVTVTMCPADMTTDTTAEGAGSEERYSRWLNDSQYRGPWTLRIASCAVEHPSDIQAWTGPIGPFRPGFMHRWDAGRATPEDDRAYYGSSWVLVVGGTAAPPECPCL